MARWNICGSYYSGLEDQLAILEDRVHKFKSHTMSILHLNNKFVEIDTTFSSPHDFEPNMTPYEILSVLATYSNDVCEHLSNCKPEQEYVDAYVKNIVVEITTNLKVIDDLFYGRITRRYP